MSRMSSSWKQGQNTASAKICKHSSTLSRRTSMMKKWKSRPERVVTFPPIFSIRLVLANKICIYFAIMSAGVNSVAAKAIFSRAYVHPYSSATFYCQKSQIRVSFILPEPIKTPIELTYDLFFTNRIYSLICFTTCNGQS